LEDKYTHPGLVNDNSFFCKILPKVGRNIPSGKQIDKIADIFKMREKELKELLLG
jgi:hypothetical protein